MEWRYCELGSVEIVGFDPQGVLFQYKSALSRLSIPGTLFRLSLVDEAFVAEPLDRPRLAPYRKGPIPAPFERTALGKKARLAWPNGATTIAEYAYLSGWGERYAIVLDDRGFSVIDAESDRVTRLMLPPDVAYWGHADPIASAGHVWVARNDGIVALPFELLEEISAGALEVTWQSQFPMRKPDARLACVFCWVLRDGSTMVEIGDGKGGPNEPKLTVALPKLDLEKYAPLELVDELHPWTYAAALVNGERIAIRGPSAIAHPSKITSARAKDPTGVARAPVSAPAVRSEQLDRLVATAIAHPDDDAHRAVLADLLIELGDPSGDAIAKVRAEDWPSPATLRDALGPLGPYLAKVEMLGGFPVEATVSPNAPDEQDHAAELAAACGDFRLSMIRTLHSQPGRRASPEVYARLAASSSSLRRVDVSTKVVIDALIAAQRDQVEYLEHVDFAKWMELLATKTFDRVTTLHTVVGLSHLQPLTNRLLKDKAKFFERAPRRLVLEETRARHRALLEALGPLWSKLPLAALTVGGVTIERSGVVIGEDEVARHYFAMPRRRRSPQEKKRLSLALDNLSTTGEAPHALRNHWKKRKRRAEKARRGAEKQVLATTPDDFAPVRRKPIRKWGFARLGEALAAKKEKRAAMVPRKSEKAREARRRRRGTRKKVAA